MRKPGEDWLNHAAIDLRTIDLIIENAAIPSRKTAALFFEQAKLVFKTVQERIQRPGGDRDEALP